MVSDHDQLDRERCTGLVILLGESSVFEEAAIEPTVGPLAVASELRIIQYRLANQCRCDHVSAPGVFQPWPSPPQHRP
ncbi:MAG: hypothetical protein ACI8TP_000972 [Acidimicrobiales bacterium]|jgi:hypothetical protein